MKIHSDELTGTPTVAQPRLEAEKRQAKRLRQLDRKLDHLNKTIEKAKEAWEASAQVESGIIDPAPVHNAQSDQQGRQAPGCGPS